jgi:hypothetical protein
LVPQEQQWNKMFENVNIGVSVCFLHGTFFGLLLDEGKNLNKIFPEN